MSYTPTTWAAGDTVTSAKLNKIEQGISDNGMIAPGYITTDGETFTCNMSFDDIWSAIQNSKCTECNLIWMEIPDDPELGSVKIASAASDAIRYQTIGFDQNNYHPVLFITTITHEADDSVSVTFNEVAIPTDGHNEAT